MNNSDSLYLGPEYDPPEIVRSMGNLLRAPRAHYSTNFTDLFSSDRQVQYHYVNGLLAVMVSFVVVIVFWTFILFVLKFRGSEVGCASGRAFLNKQTGEEESSTDEDDGSFSSAGSRGTSQQGSIAKLIKRKEGLDNFLSADTEGEDGPPTDPMTKADEGSFDDASGTGKVSRQIHPRERRTRFCFLLFCVVALVCVPTILVTSSGELKKAAETSHEPVLSARGILADVSTSIDTIVQTITSANETLQGATLRVEEVCPNVNAGEFEEVLGVDLNALVATVTDEFALVMEISEAKVEYVQDLLQSIDGGLVAYETSVETVEGWIWMIPATLFAVSVLTIVASMAVLLAWKGNAGKKMQNTMSYVILPLLMAATIACWIIVLVTSLGTMLGSDMCTGSTSEWSPDETIQQILAISSIDPNSTELKAALSYTNRCLGPSPTEDIESLQHTVQDNIDKIWRLISTVDSLGRDRIMETCGGIELEDLLTTARDIALALTTVRRSLEDIITSLSCHLIYPLYASAVHGTVCSSAASAAACGFFFFLILGISMMVIMSLRASWLQNVQEEKVYHDESEMAENMILDEHEEYLAYISKYKHEWQEYRGFEERPISPTMGVEDNGSYSSRSNASTYSGEEYPNDDSLMESCDETSEASTMGYQIRVVPTESTRESSQPRDDISLLDLDIMESTTTPQSVVEEDMRSVPAPMLPPPRNPDFHRGRSPYAHPPTVPVVESDMSKSQAMKHSSGGFFEKYGIAPGSSVRNKAAKSGTSAFSKRDPPEDVPHSTLQEPSPNNHMANQEQVAARRPENYRRMGRLPSSRVFFKAETAVDDEVEIHLIHGSSTSRHTGSHDEEIYEC